MYKNIRIFLLLLFIITILFGFFLLTLVFSQTSSPCYDLRQSSLHYMFNNNISDIVLTFTTMPKRLESEEIKRSINAMLLQTMRAKEIRINIPYVSKRTGKDYVIPDWFKFIPITIVRCEDFGPATKYIPTLQYFNEQIMLDQKILVYDDDSIAPLDLLENFYKLSKLYPAYAITTTSYRFIDEGKEQFGYFDVTSKINIGKKILMNMFGKTVKELDENEMIYFSDIVTGWTGFLLTPNMVNFQDLTDFENLPESAFFVDDVVMSASLLKNGTKIVVGKGLNEPMPTFAAFFENLYSSLFKIDGEALSFSANRSHSHDEIMHEYYRQYWQFLK